ncbi:phage integrase family protein [Cupriavidus lacunae]|nr:phage integrase family protein [Cupriavidus lacunae]
MAHRSVLRPHLHRGHFCYLRGKVQGLSPKFLWERYLADQGDYDEGPAVHRMTGFIRQELVATAARAGNFGRAHLLRLDLAPLPAEGALPSLDTFVREHGLDGFGESEQQALYAERYGSDLDVQRRRTVLLRRQLLAIHALERQLCVPVSRFDACEVWFVDAIAQRLASHGIDTLGALHARMAAAPGWWRGLKGIGAGKAQALERFVQAHAATLGVLPEGTASDAPDDGEVVPTPLHPDPVAPTVSPLVPLERLALPNDLSGRSGQFRGPREFCLLAADDDLAAVHAFLSARAPASDAGRPTLTFLSYRKECERFLLWAVVERGKPLSGCNVEDCAGFRDFLLDPPGHWCAPRAIPRWHAGWRPLEGPLSASSCGYALGVLNNLFSFLVAQGYLRGNPWRGVQAPRVDGKRAPTGRALSDAQWQWVRQRLAALPLTLANRRLRVAVRLLYEGGLRLSELVCARTSNLVWRELVLPSGALAAGWWLTVVGKGGRVREVPVSDAWVAELGDYLAARGLASDLRQVLDVPVLSSAARDAEPADGVSANVFHTTLKTFLSQCADALEASDPLGAARLRQATCHWLRHTHVTHALNGGADVHLVQANVGHASLHTTTRYVTTDDARRAQALRRWWAGGESVAVSVSSE